jgi:hypothetical protein
MALSNHERVGKALVVLVRPIRRRLIELAHQYHKLLAGSREVGLFLTMAQEL